MKKQMKKQMKKKHDVEVLKPGLLSTVQDLGRYGYQRQGVVVAGAMDDYALQMANLLVGNTRDDACLEFTLVGGQFRFCGEHVIALTGADFQASVGQAPIQPWQAMRVQDGDILKMGAANSGCRAYLAIRGGIDVPLVLGSRSTYMKARMGGFQGRALQKGDHLSIFPRKESLVAARARSKWRLSEKLRPVYEQPALLRVIAGPEEDAFTGQGIKTFYETEYVVSKDADRMGYRLDGSPIEHLGSADLLSNAIAIGSIQVPSSGRPIIMMADRQTTGGYPKIATIVRSDLAKIAQVCPGQKVIFEKVSLAQARHSWLEKERALSAFEKQHNL